MSQTAPINADVLALTQAQLQAQGLVLTPEQVQRLAKALARLGPLDETAVSASDRDFLAVLARCRHA